MVAKQKKPVDINVSIDHSRGKRYIFSWTGFNKEIFNALRSAGAQTEKHEDEWVIWSAPAQFNACIKTLDALEITLISDFDIDFEMEQTIAVAAEPYEIIQVGTETITLHFPYNRPMINAIKAIPKDGRSFDEYTKDWSVQHRYLSLLINTWRALGVPVKRLEEIKTVVTYN
jgi:hypothetical protein